jgi:hypothetical protein
MLYDPKWEQQTKADPFKIETLIAWLEKQPADCRYDFDNCDGECLFGLYYTAMGLKWWDEYLEKHFDHTAIACGWPETFGGALERARAFQVT